jgi:hypothetical protein
MFTFTAFTTAIPIAIHIPGDITTFGGVSRAASAMSMIEKMRDKSELLKPMFLMTKGRGYQLRSFQVNSPAETSIFADPAWIAVYLGVISLGLTALQTLGSYGKIKEGVKEFSADLSALKKSAIQNVKEQVDAISELTQVQRDELQLGAALFLGEFADSAEEFSNRVLRSSHFVTVVMRERKLPSIKVQPDNGDPKAPKKLSN